ncbi:hypothetical protein MP638_003771 [Amoeboaphelidium occidentale]|nr:hypothetical protein MP638_003771 [Amoeboaphelidium occidentale]
MSSNLFRLYEADDDDIEMNAIDLQAGNDLVMNSVLEEQHHAIEDQHKYGHLPLPLRLLVKYHFTASLREKFTLAVSCLLLVLLVLLGFMFVHGNASTVVTVPRVDGVTNVTSHDVCTSKGCIRSSARIMSMLNEKVSPCDDFYEFSCGNFMKYNDVPTGETKIDAFTEMRRRNELRMKYLLESGFDALQNADTQMVPLYDKAKDLYSTCMNTSHIESQGMQPLINFLKEFFNVFPASYNDITESPTVVLAKGLAFLQKRGIDVLFTTTVTEYTVNSTRYVPSLQQGGLTFPEMQMYKDAKARTKVAGVIAETLYLVYKHKGDNEWMPEEQNQRASFFKDIAADIISLETDLAQHFVKEDELLDELKEAESFSLQSLNKDVKFLNWTTYFENYLPTKVTLDSNYTVVSPTGRYLKSISSIFEGSSFETMRRYLVWKIVSKFMEHMPAVFMKQSVQFTEITKNRMFIPERWNTCVDFANSAGKLIISEGFVKSFFPYKEHDSAVKTLTSLEQALIKSASNSEWLSKESKHMISKIFNDLESRIGFASYVANSSFLLEYHKDLVVDQKDFFVNLINSEIFFRKQKLSLLWIPSLEKVFQESPQDTNVQYYPNNNMITIPVGSLSFPLIDANVPSVLNYASFGSVLGFHLTDAFRHLSRNLNKEAAALFETKLECFGKEFDVSEGTDEIEKQRKSLQQFVALSSGLDLSYSAYNSSNADGSKLALPGLKFSSDQLFFMWYAQTWCGKERVQNNGASTFFSNKNLVNGAVKNNPSFTKAFKCQKTSQPNCSLWY